MSVRGAVVAIWLAMFALGLSRAEGAERAEPNERNPVVVRLVADVSEVGLGEAFRLGALLTMAPGWHIYWTFPGNTGRSTRVAFRSAEEHTKVLEPAFPAPQVFDAERIEDLSFGYSGSVLIPANAMVFDQPPEGRTRIAATLSWLACKQVCITGRAERALTLPLGDRPRPSAEADLFDRTQRRIPGSLDGEQAWLESLEYEKGHFRLRIVMPGLQAAKDFVPSWVPGAACKVDAYRLTRDERDRPLAELRLHGDNCLPGVGGVLLGTPAGALSEAAFKPYAVSARAPVDDAQATQAAPAARAAAVARPPEGRTDSLGWLLLFAFLGGLLLNVMPCVIPVVVPKLLHVVRTAQKTEHPAERRRLLWSNSLAYTAGVVATLLSLGALVAVLKWVGHDVGWGFQFQNAWFLVFMISLLIVLGLGMLHVYPLQGASHADDLKQLRKTRRRSPLLESFLTGLLVTFLGTPCTAPLLGPALGYAFTSSTPQILLFMATVAVGLASPFLLLGAWTGWTRVLPTRVTERYDRIMRGMAFLLFGTAVWLLGVLAAGHGSTLMINVLWFELSLAAGAWVFGLVVTETERWGRRLVKLLPIALGVGAIGWWMLGFPADTQAKSPRLQSRVGIRWQAFDEDKVAELRGAGKTVFIDFTAEWCMNCKANERLVIETEKTKGLLDELGIVAFKADHTRFDPVIQAWLKRYGRAGVPMYLVFSACARDRDAVLLPEILTSSRLHQALHQAGPSRNSCPVAGKKKHFPP